MPDSRAEEEFKSVVDMTGVALKPFGFTKRGARFLKFYGPNLVLIQFQKSRYNEGKQVRFTVNVSVVSAFLARELWGIVDLKRTSAWHGHLRERIGFFSDKPADIWWTVGVGGALQEAGAAVVHLLLSKVLPFLSTCTSDDDLLTLWKSGRSPGLTAFQRDQYAAVLERSLN